MKVDYVDAPTRPSRSLKLSEDVAKIIRGVGEQGFEAVREYTKRFDGVELAPERVRVDEAELDRALAALDPAVRGALETAIANVERVAAAQRRERVEVVLDQGQRIEVVDLPVGRAAVYAPAGRAPYPSSLVMGAVTARVAGVPEIVACAPPDAEGESDPVILAACALCGVREVYRFGGAQAIAALALGAGLTRVDVIVGPGNAYVQEAKHQLSWTCVGIDGYAGASELLVIAAGAEVDATAVALDLAAQAEHGAESLLWLLSSDSGLADRVVSEVRGLEARPSVYDALLQVSIVSVEEAVAHAERIAPEHLELVGADAEARKDEIRRAGCLFVGAKAATAFGDYVAGSNHVLPTGGAARFQSALSVATFRRRMARVSLPGDAATRLAGPGAALARAEGFPVHAESMERRA